MMDLHQALNQFKGAADWVGLRLVSEKTTQRMIRNERPDSNQVYFDQGLMVEVLYKGHFAYAGTCDLTTAGVQKAFQQALRLAQEAAPHKVHHFSEKTRPAAKGQYHSPVEKPLDAMSTAEITDLLIEATKTMKISDKIINRVANVMIIETDSLFISSNGSNVHQNFSIVSTDFNCTAAEGTENQLRSDNGGLARCHQIGAEVFNRTEILTRARRIAEESLQLLAAENCPNEKMDLLIAPDQMTLQVHESIGHPLEYDRILGDERNYAGWSFVKPSDFGHLRYGSSLMNVTFDPSVSDSMASYSFDDAGVQATREYLIRDGLLVRGLGGLESQERLGLPGVANSRASSWNRAPIDRMANINLEPGTSNLQDMIASVEKGVFMHANKSWSIDDYRNKFQFGCEYAQLIENGRLTKVVKNPNYRGTTVAFWNSLKAVSKNIETYGSPFCGKGEPNQVIRVGHTTPYCLFSNVEVFGA